MIFLFYAFAILILLHCLLLISGLLQYASLSKAWFSWLQTGGMLLAGITAIALQSWPLLVGAFGVYRLVIAAEMAFLAWRSPRALSVLFPVNLFMGLWSLLVLFTEIWWLFALGYGCFWVLSLTIGKRLLQSKVHSST